MHVRFCSPVDVHIAGSCSLSARGGDGRVQFVETSSVTSIWDKLGEINYGNSVR